MSPRVRPLLRLLAPLLVTLAAGCIKRTAAPPPATAPATASRAPAVDDNKPNPVQEAANARLAGVAHTDLVGPDGVKAFQPMGEVAKVELTPFTVAGQPFTDAVRVDIKEGSSHEYAVQMATKIAAAVKAGDAILATFYLRTETPQEGSVGETEFVFELAGSPYTKSVSYPVQGPERWTRIQVRFESVSDYAPGEAQMIFRLGYDPQVIELGGIRVESYGKLIALGDLPSSQGADRRRERAAAKAAKAAAANQTGGLEGGPLAFQIDPAQVVRPISPYVYGISSQPPEGLGVTARRMGGNRQTAYNWEINASSAGSDYQQSSDEWACTAMGYTGCNQPGAQFLQFAQANRKLGIETIATIPIVDYVVADKNGTVSAEDKAPSKRWRRSLPKKPGTPASLSLTPDLADNNVYEDEFVNLLVKKLGPADKGGVRFYSLDNEPALWPTTHPRVHPAKTTYAEMAERTGATASEIVKLDPSAMVLGGVMFGWSEYLSLSDAPDAKANNDKYGSYLDYFLATMKKLEDEQKKRLVHVLDVHWYPEARGAKRITDKDLSPKTVSARLQAVRSLWDPTYVEKSWIANQLGGKPIRLIPWMLERIAERYPGTKLGMTEYNFGVGDHISGGLAQIDALGVFGREGMYLANYWGDGPGNGKLPPYIATAFKLYRNYDGKGGTFGDTAVTATTDVAKASIFAATDSKRPGVLTIIVINKDLRAAFNGTFALGAGGQTKARVFSVDATSAEIKAQPEIDIKGGQLAYRLPPLSATLFVCEKR